MLSLTGQYVFAVLMALSQFVTPYSEEQVKTFTEGKELEQWQIDAYNFTPKGPVDLMFLSGNEIEIARYVRSSCVRIFSSTQTQRSIDRGNLPTLDFDFLFSSVVNDDFFNELQKRLLGEEQGIRLVESKEFLKAACDVKVSLEDLSKYNLHYAANYYLSVFRDLPKIRSLEDMPKLSEVSFVKDRNGEVIGEYSLTEVKNNLVVRRNRRRLSKEPFPVMLKKALVSIEDSRFWNFIPKGQDGYEGHNGVDFKGLFRAAQSTGSGQGVQGGSTISMQLAKNLILYEDVAKESEAGKRSILRKLKEYILVKMLEDVLSKDQILDWYLNTIDFGRRTQGAVLASEAYFGKPVFELRTQDYALLASLPKFPNAHILSDEEGYKTLLDRRNKVLREMKKEDYISREDYKTLKETEIDYVAIKPITAHYGYSQHYVSAVQKQMTDWLSRLDQYQGLGFDISVPIDHKMQKWAVESLQRGLLDFERKSTGRRALTVKPSEDNLPNIKEQVEKLAASLSISNMEAFPMVLQEVKNPYPDATQFKLGVILSNTQLGLPSGEVFNRQPEDRNGQLYKIDDGKKNLEVWDVVLLQEFPKTGGVYYKIASFPEVTGGMVVLDNKTGEVLATSGGFSVGVGYKYKGTGGNKAFSAMRQPGSTVKPFTYLYALSQGVSPSRILPNRNLVMPVRKRDGRKICNRWSLSSTGEASHYNLRTGLERSKNRLTANVFLAASGVYENADPADYADQLSDSLDILLYTMKSYGLYQDLKDACYPIMLGASETTVKDIAGAYATFANGGVYKEPFTVLSVTRNGQVARPFERVNRVDDVILETLRGDGSGSERNFNLFRVRTMLQGVLKRGTARSISEWSNIIAGKTGTTNDYRDAWFVGYNKKITVAVWVGYAKGRTLGSKQEGGKVALPIFKDFMDQYYKEYPADLELTFSDQPPSGVTARIEPSTGFIVDNQFISDFRYYTGTQGQPSSVVEYYASASERDSSVRYYYGTSRAAGQLFFRNLSNSWRESYRQQYNQDKAQKQNDKDYYQQICAFYQSQGYQKHQINECQWADQIRIISFESFYLNKMGFTQ